MYKKISLASNYFLIKFILYLLIRFFADFSPFKKNIRFVYKLIWLIFIKKNIQNYVTNIFFNNENVYVMFNNIE